MEGLAAAAVVGAIYLAGGVVKGGMGFGLPLVTISVLPFLMPVEEALALNAVVLLAVNAIQVAQSGMGREAARISLPILLGVAVTTPVAVGFATALPRTLLLGLLGVFIIGFCVLSLRGQIRIGTGMPGPGRGAALGGVAGVVGALTSAPGPVFVMGLSAAGLERRLFMGTMGLLMGVVGLALAGSFAVAGVLTPERLAAGAVCTLPALVGFWIGDRLGRRFSVEGFRRAVLLLLILLGTAMIHRAATAG